MNHLTSLDEHGHALLEQAAEDLSAEVRSCPGWTVADLVRHIGRVWGLVEEIARTRATSRPQPPKPPADRDQWLPWATSMFEGLTAALRDLPDDEPVWNWSVQPNTGRFWPRRMNQETLVHRWDLEHALDCGWTIPPDFAADGIDEFFDAFLPLLQGLQPVEGLEGTLHLHATDGAGEWLVALQPATFTVTREHAKGDVAVRGTGSQLLLWVWNRVPLSSLDCFGDSTVLDVWRERVRI